MHKTVSSYFRVSRAAQVLASILVVTCVIAFALLMIGEVAHMVGKAICLADHSATVGMTTCK